MRKTAATGRDTLKWRAFDRTLKDVKICFSDLSANDLEKLIAESLAHVRREGDRRKKRTRK